MLDKVLDKVFALDVGVGALDQADHLDAVVGEDSTGLNAGRRLEMTIYTSVDGGSLCLGSWST